MIAPPPTWIDAVVVAQPAERGHRSREERGGEDERHRQPERVHAEERRPLERRVRRAGEDEDRSEHRPDARRGADGERAAEQDARAAASRLLQQPGSDEALRPRQQPHEREPEHDEDEARDALEEELVAEDATADERSTDAEENEEGREAEDERNAPPDHTPSVPGLAELVGVDRRDGREVGRHERQHARREKRDHPGEERDRDRRPAHALSRRIARAPRPRGARAPGRAARPTARTRRSAAPRADEETDRDRAAEERAERQQPGEETEAAVRRLGEHLGAELRDKRVLDLLLGVAGRDPNADERLHALGDGSVRLVERRLAHGADELGLEIGGVRRRSGRGAGDERGAEHGRERESAPHVSSAWSMAARSLGRDVVAVDCAGERLDHASLAVEHERLGKAGHAVAVESCLPARRTRAGT